MNSIGRDELEIPLAPGMNILFALDCLAWLAVT